MPTWLVWRTRYSISTSSLPSTVASSSTVTAEHVDPRLVAAQRFLDLGPDPLKRRAVDRGEHEIVDAAAEIGPHHPLARRGLEDDPDRLADVLLVFDGERRARCAGSSATGIAQPRPRKSLRSSSRRSSDHHRRRAGRDRVRAARPRRPCRPGAPPDSPPIITVVLPDRDDAADMRLQAVDQRAGVRCRDLRPPCRLAADQHGRAAGPGRERRAVTGRDRRPVRQVVPSCRLPSVDVDQRAANVQRRACLDVERARRFDA